MLEEIVLKCLKICDHKKASTIAFPALGSGALKYPPEVVAKVMVTTVQNYFQTNPWPNTCIKEVKFVMYTDDAYEEFASILSQYSKSVAVTPPSMGPNPITQAFSPSYHSISTPSTTVPTAIHPFVPLSSVGNNMQGAVATKAPITICTGKLLKEKVQIIIATYM